MTKEELVNAALKVEVPKIISESGFEIVAPVWLAENPNASIIDVKSFIYKFFSAYNNRPSERASGKMTTVSDPLTD